MCLSLFSFRFSFLMDIHLELLRLCFTVVIQFAVIFGLSF